MKNQPCLLLLFMLLFNSCNLSPSTAPINNDSNSKNSIIPSQKYVKTDKIEDIEYVPEVPGNLNFFSFRQNNKWSPDSKKLVFSRAYKIFMTNFDATDTRVIIDLREEDANLKLKEEIDPVWSPDGKKISFMTNKEGVKELYVINIIDQYLRHLRIS